MTSMLFSGTKHASLYSKFRPSPPVELINSIISYLRAKILTPYKQAIDIGCGSGQSTIVLAPYFKKVIGLDISEAQIECAKQERSAANIEYKVSSCTTFPYADSSVQLVTSSQAIHWFDTCKLFNEVKRIVQPNGVIAVYGYWIPLPKTDNEEKNKKFVNLICDKLHEEQLGKYWDDERYIVKNHYADINFPFKDVQRLNFVKKSECTLADYIGYLSTWSAYQKLYTEDNNAGGKILKDTEEETMPGGRTKFQAWWLESRDKNGDFISNWCTQGRNENEAYCTLCRSYFSISNSGFSQVLQHSAGQKHLSASKTLRGQRTLLGNLWGTNEAELGTNSESNLLQLSNDQMVAHAEALWAMKVAISNFSFASSKDIVQLFQTMFEGHPVAKHMSLGERKISYILSHGLGPYFRKELISDLKTSDSWYTLAFDETTTSQIKKQLDIYVRFWSAKSAKIVNAYLYSIFLGHADSDTICSSIINTLNESRLPLAKILMLSMDGPHANLSVAKKLNAELMKANSAELVNIGTCSLHKVHNCFSKAVTSLPFDIDQFATDLFSFFKCSAARREDLKDLQKLLDCEQKFLLRHVSSRWLTLGPVVKRILLVYPSLLEYFLKFLPKQKSNTTLPQNSRYLRIIACLKDKLTVAYLEFISDLSSIFESYLTLFQSEGPLIHLLYNKMNGLVRSIMIKFLKQDCVGTLEGLSLKNIILEDPESHLPMKEIDIGVGARRAVSHLKECERTRTTVTMRKCLIKLTKCLIESLPISDTILRDLEVLHPLMRTDSSDNAVRRLCLAMKALKLDDQTIDCIVREWQVYRIDPDIPKICDEFCAVEKGVGEREVIKYQRLDIYWAKILKLNDKYTGKLKYENLSKLIKCCLSLSHSNADIERGFSLNNAIVTNDRPNISESVIIGIRLVKDAVSRHGNIFNVPITGKLLKSIATAHSAYAEFKKKVQEENKMRLHDSDESNSSKKLKMENKNDLKIEIKKQIKCLQEELVSAQALLNEGNERLLKGIKRKDFKEINVASAMIDSGTLKFNELTAKLKEAQDKELDLISETNQL